MTVLKLQGDADFVQKFQFAVVQYISAVREFEALDSKALAEKSKDPDVVGLDLDELTRYNALKVELPQLRANLNFEVIRIRDISSRYQGTGLNEGWLYHLPGSGRNNPQYVFQFQADLENSILRDLVLIRAAIGEDTKHQQRLALRPWYKKRFEDQLEPVARWFLKPEHSKYTAIAILLIVVAFVLSRLGYDAKGIVEIIKAVKGSAK